MSSGETTSSGAHFCLSCGAPAATSAEARFCYRCGQPLSAESESRHVFGALQPGPTLVLGCLLVVGAVLALVAGSVLVAILLGVLAAATLVLFYGALRRFPQSRVAQALSGSRRRMRGWTVFGKESAGAWARATRDVSRIRAQLRALRRERKRTIVALGEAAYREDAALAGALRLRLREIDEGIEAREHARAASLARARRRVRDEHVAVQPTQRFSVDELAAGGESAPDED